MRTKGLPRAHSDHPNVTPLIDVVMCMIVFYMLAAKIGVSSGKEAEIELPESWQGKQLPDLGNAVTINVEKPPTGEEQPIVKMLNPNTGDMETLKIHDAAGKKPLKQRLQLLMGEGASVQNADFKVIIRADQNMAYRYLEPVLVTCAETQVKDKRTGKMITLKNINFAARQPQAVKAEPGTR
jgi:biopolymer transport protein ExbD